MSEFVHYTLHEEPTGGCVNVSSALHWSTHLNMPGVKETPDGIPYNPMGVSGPTEFVYPPGAIMRRFGSTFEKRLVAARQRVEAKAAREVERGLVALQRYEAAR